MQGLDRAVHRRAHDRALQVVAEFLDALGQFAEIQLRLVQQTLGFLVEFAGHAFQHRLGFLAGGIGAQQ